MNQVTFNEVDFASLVIEIMGEIISRYHLSLIQINKYDLLLKRSEYALMINFNIHDGISICYIDLLPTKKKTYPLINFLVHKRWKKLPQKTQKTESVTFYDYLKSEISGANQILQCAAEDILRGDRLWLNEYNDWIRGLNWNIPDTDLEILKYLE